MFIVIFFALVGLLGYVILYASMIKQLNAINEARTLSSITNLANSPEFSCGKSKPGCVDGDKIMGLSNSSVYKNFWPFSSLTVVRFVAFNKSMKDMIKCESNNYPNCEKFVIYDKKVKNERSIASFVSLCFVANENNIIYQKCEIARLVAGTEIQNVKWKSKNL